MTLTIAQLDARSKDEQIIERAKKRLLRLYGRLGNWRAVGAECGVNHGHCIALVNDGRVPHNPILRLALGLPRVMPSERRAYEKAVTPTIGITDRWESRFLKQVKRRVR